MKKIMFASLCLTTLLAACGGGNSSPNPPAPKPTPTTTLNQGVWGWVIADPETETVIDTGAFILNQEFNGDYGKLAGGVYSNQAQTQQGVTIMGPIAAKGALQAAFSYDTTNSKRLYLLAADDDDKLENYQGKAAFFGPGALLDANNKVSREILVAFVQNSTTVPTGNINTQKEYAAKVAEAYGQAAMHASVKPLSNAVLKQLTQVQMPEFAR